MILFLTIGTSDVSEVPSGTVRCRHFANRQLLAKWSKVKSRVCYFAGSDKSRNYSELH